MDIFDLHGKTALITGASSGLGARFAHVLAKAGARVILTARRLDKLETIANEIRRKGFDAVPIIMNVAQKKSVQKVISKLTTQGEKIDILVNNAGIAKFTPIFELDTQNNFESIRVY
ncbi:MAG TPA: SDR family NAD(P)-dependent oxidoreductase [Candidatus Megaira endosymbiont of Stentor roeselii]|nr:SDR family NAD(P)-dependent oxidoreductase [Candidatus Megaera endosymbiont of Stentor roeselii]